MKTFFHPAQRLHHPQSYYSRGKMRAPQELPHRVDGLLAAAEQLGFEVLTPPDAGLDPILAVHDRAYLDFLRDSHGMWVQLPEDWGDEVMSNIFVREPNPLRGVLAQAARYLADGSCPIGRHTWQSAYWSAQSALAGARALIDGESYAYALCRPPGHHARVDAAGGFCYLNNAAIAAQALRERFARVALVDTDMHHGQGTQEIFYSRSDVLYVSIHADPTDFYPVVAGHAEERGEGAGEGFNLNLPMPHGSDEAVFMARLDEALDAVRAFGAEAVVLSLGFDIYAADPQSKVAVGSSGFDRLGRAFGGLALPTLIVQEGGYHTESLADNARSFFGGLCGAALALSSTGQS